MVINRRHKRGFWRTRVFRDLGAGYMGVCSVCENSSSCTFYIHIVMNKKLNDGRMDLRGFGQYHEWLLPSSIFQMFQNARARHHGAQRPCEPLHSPMWMILKPHYPAGDIQRPRHPLSYRQHTSRLREWHEELHCLGSTLAFVSIRCVVLNVILHLSPLRTVLLSAVVKLV